MAIRRNSDGVSVERSGYRDDSLTNRIQENWGDGFVCTDIQQQDLDKSISKRHRTWGYNCPATNIDCLFYEYNRKQPVAIIEYKGRQPNTNDRTTANTQASVNLANAANVPFFIVYYDNDYWTFAVDPLNHIAIQLVTKHADFQQLEKISEFQFLRFLYNLRGQTLPEDIQQKLHRETESVFG